MVFQECSSRLHNDRESVCVCPLNEDKLCELTTLFSSSPSALLFLTFPLMEIQLPTTQPDNLIIYPTDSRHYCSNTISLNSFNNNPPSLILLQYHCPSSPPSTLKQSDPNILIAICRYKLYRHCSVLLYWYTPIPNNTQTSLRAKARSTALARTR